MATTESAGGSAGTSAKGLAGGDGAELAAGSVAGPVGRIRWTILAMLFAVTVINYADRAALSLAAPAMVTDLHITPFQLGLVFSAFGWSYCVAQAPGGWLLDRFGVVRIYLLSILFWSALTAAHSIVLWMSGTAAVTVLFTLRFAVGLAEAPSFPGNARLATQWFPARERGTAVAIFNSAQYFATVLFAPLLGWIVVTFGWEWSFVFMGVVGFVAFLLWPRLVHQPLRHPRLKPAELAYITTGGAVVDPDAKRPQTSSRDDTMRKLGVLLGTPKLWGLYLGQFCINTLTFFFITWLPVYLVDERGLSIIRAGLFVTIPALSGFLGGLLGGMFSDWLLRRGASQTMARKVPIVSGMLLALSILGCIYANSILLLLVFMSLAFLGKGIGAQGWVVMADLAPRDSVGLAGGVFNTFGNMSTVLSPIVIGYILARTGSFDLVLVMIAGAALTAALSFLLFVGRIERIGGD